MVPRQLEATGHPAPGQFIDDLPVPVLVVDVAGDRIIEVNAAAADLASCEPRDLLAIPLSRALADDGDTTELRVGERAISVHVLRPDDWRNRRGPVHFVLLDRLQLGLIGMDGDELRDEARRMRRQLDEFQTGQGRLVSVWAHELKTPLTVVQSYLEILTTELDEGLSPEQLSFLTISYDSVMRLRRLVLDLVDLIGFRSGHLSLETAPVDVDSLLDETIDEMKPIAESADLELVLERPAVRVAIRADGDRVRQIIHNLLDNAFKFTPPGGRVEVRTRVERDWVIIEVADNGIGIDESDMGRVFEEFVQLKRSGIKRRQRGSGLGLAISRRIAEAHGGSIEVSSEVDSGSVFSVRLPRDHDEID